MHGPDALIDARLEGTRAPAWVATVCKEGIFGGVLSHCRCFAEGDLFVCLFVCLGKTRKSILCSLCLEGCFDALMLY